MCARRSQSPRLVQKARATNTVTCVEIWATPHRTAVSMYHHPTKVAVKVAKEAREAKVGTMIAVMTATTTIQGRGLDTLADSMKTCYLLPEATTTCSQDAPSLWQSPDSDLVQEAKELSLPTVRTRTLVRAGVTGDHVMSVANTTTSQPIAAVEDPMGKEATMVVAKVAVTTEVVVEKVVAAVEVAAVAAVEVVAVTVEVVEAVEIGEGETGSQTYVDTWVY